jgi:hypothetical protein
MTAAVADCLVENHDSLVAGLDLPDADDRHVLAAAIRCGAQVIVTANLTDFPAAKLAPFDIEAQHPDEFILHLIDLAPGVVVGALQEQAAALKKPPRSVGELLDILESLGLVQSVAALLGLVAAG